jgi:hypothetical protein
MKLRLLMVMASAVLFLAPRPVSAVAADGQPAAPASGRALMQQNANESEQATTDIPLGETVQGQPVRNVSYGGVAAWQSESGNRETQPCGSAPQCKI